MRIGLFLNALISFLVIGAAIFFIVVKPMNAINARSAKDEEAEPEGPTEVELLTEIRDELRKSCRQLPTTTRNGRPSRRPLR